MQAEIIVVGAGITGATLAERCASVLGKRVLVLDKRDHVGGNCYDYQDGAGILVPKYGPHFFHTDHEEVWDYLSRFTDWHPYEHRVLSFVDGKFVPVPVNIDTVNSLFSLDINDESTMKTWLEANRVTIECPVNSEESALARVGPRLYEKMFKHYTIKQWSIEPKELDSSVMDRIPVRCNRDDRYFGDKYQAMPAEGYTRLFKRMLEHPKIEVRLSTDYFEIRDELGASEALFFTGPIDRFFEYRFGALQYRSLTFRFETLNQEFYQARAQVNYPNDHDFTR
ncbi:MAG: UDP-galactopyranose mutase, partial [Candidatus Solincola sediminis]